MKKTSNMETEKEINEFGQRINELMFMFDYNQSTFARKIGTSQPTVRSIIKGKTNPRYELITSVLNAFPGLSREWLMDGKGEAFPDGGPNPPAAAQPKPNDYLMEQLAALEKSWKESLEESKRISTEKEKIITQQNFMIETLMSQLTTALGKLDLSEELLPVSPLVITKAPAKVIPMPAHSFANSGT